MVDFRLPELKPANVNYVNAFAKGYATPDAMMAPGLANELVSQKIDLANRQKAAGEEYQRTNDINALSAYAPMEVAKVRALEQKRESELTLPRLKVAYALGGEIWDPRFFDQKRKLLVSADPWFDKTLPPIWTPEAAEWLKQQHKDIGRTLKAETGAEVGQVYDARSGTWITPPGKGKVSVIQPDRGMSFDERVQLKTTPGASSGRGASGGGRPEVITAAKQNEKEYQEYNEVNPERKVTRSEYFNTIKPRLREEAKQQVKPNETVILDTEAPDGKSMTRTINKRRAGEGAATKSAGTPDFFNSFKNAIAGPNRDAAIKRSQELKDGYYERAKKEGLL